MTKFSFSVPSIALSVQGADFEVDPSTFAPIALEAIFVYGVRRWFQDNINSAAHAVKTARAEAIAKGETFTGEFNVKDAFAARLLVATSGELSAARVKSSGPAFTDLELAIYDVAVKSKTAPAFKPVLVAWNASKGADIADRRTAILSAVAALPDPARLALIRAAETDLATRNALAGLALAE